MEQQQLKTLIATNEFSIPNRKDIYSPYSFLEWKGSFVQPINEKYFFDQYKNYILTWLQENKDKTISAQFLLRQRYLFLLQHLQVYFSTKEASTWYSKINLLDEKELLLSIPFFAKKLKQIAQYYAKIRAKLKQAKRKYNTTGTEFGIASFVSDYILNVVSTKDEEFSLFADVLPSFDSIKNNLSISIEDVYDENSYFDRSPYLPLSSYVDVFHEQTADFFLTKGIILSADGDIFNALTFGSLSSVEAVTDILTGDITEAGTSSLYRAYLEKFLGSDRISGEIVVDSGITTLYPIELQQGNNYFYFPGGTEDTNIKIKQNLPKVKLNDLSTEGATAGEELSSSDVIFVKNGNNIEAAWLRRKNYEETQKTVKAFLKKGTYTSFIYPFPGFGVSDVDNEWSGPTWEYDDNYLFLATDIKADVNSFYWSQTLPDHQTPSLLLFDTSLIDDGAASNSFFEEADKIYISPERPEDTTLPLTTEQGAWLYKFEQTSVPISTQSTDSNVILWPYGRVDVLEKKDEGFVDKISLSIKEDTCEAINVNDLTSRLFTAGTVFEQADKIYKIETPYDTDTTKATECCWLSSLETNESSMFRSHSQDGIALRFQSGEYTWFVWSGPEMPVKDVFVEISHQKDCKFSQTTELTSFQSERWNECSCKQPYYSPFGHSGETFEQNSDHCDFICEYFQENIKHFDIASWKDSEENSIRQSSNFAWYKTLKSRCWGSGQWSTFYGATSNMKLLPGKCYVYKRAISRTNDPYPPYVVIKKFDQKKTKWITAKKTDKGEWKSTGETSNMNIGPGDFLFVDKQQNTTSYLLSTVTIKNESANKGSLWSNYDYVVVNSDRPTTTISWPVRFQNNVTFEQDSSQIPTLNVDQISAITWTITCDQDPALTETIVSPYKESPEITQINEDGSNIVLSWHRTYTNVLTWSFTPPRSGTYTIRATVIDKNYTTHTIDTQIPKITADSEFREEQTPVELKTPNSGFLLEQQLTGWNYTVSDTGAKPYWATIYNDKDESTKFKGVRSWGYSRQYIDDYLPVVLPVLSPLTINYGDVIKYYREKKSFFWNQTIDYKLPSTKTAEWCKLLSNTTVSNLSSIHELGNFRELMVTPTLSASDIVLSNNLNGSSVEIYFHALSAFTWNVVLSSEEITPDDAQFLNSAQYITANQPTHNLSNRYHPTIAIMPTLDQTYTNIEVGSHFNFSNLGALQYVNKNFKATVKADTLSGVYITEDPSVYVGGRGLSFNDNYTIYEWEENNQWIKEPIASNLLTGYVSKDITKELQTFIPYYSKTTNDLSIGILLPKDYMSPWTGAFADQWNDLYDVETVEITNIKNTKNWLESPEQQLKKTEQPLQFWLTDIYGTQYGVYKDTEATPIWSRKQLQGQAWVKKANNKVLSLPDALPSLLSMFSTNESLYHDLSGNKILQLDCLFDVLFLTTENAFVATKIGYNYESSDLTCSLENTTTINTSNGVVHEQCWHFPEKKQTVALFTKTQGQSFWPEFVVFDLNNINYIGQNVFPNNQEDINELKTITANLTKKQACLTYNNTKNLFLITYNCLDSTNDTVIVNMAISFNQPTATYHVDVYR